MKRIGRLSAVYTIGAVFGKSVAFVMLPVYTRYLSPQDYGLLQLVETTMEILSIIAGSRLATGIYHFYHKAPSPEQKRAVLSTALLVLAAAFSVAGALALALAPTIARIVFDRPEATILIQVAGLNLFAQSLIIVPAAYMQLMEQSGRYVMVNAAKLALQVALNLVLLVGLHLGALGILLSSLISNVVLGLSLLAMLLPSIGIRFDGAAARDLLKFGAPFIGTHIGKYLVTYGDRYILQFTAGTAVLGVYGLAYQFAFLLVSIGDAPYRTAWEAIRFAVAARPDRDEVYARAFIHLNLIQVSLAVMISVFIPEFLRVMATPPFYQAGNWVPVILAAYLLQSWSFFLNTGLFVSERTGLITVATWLGAAMALAAYIVLIPPLGGLGAALATLMSFAVLHWFTYRYSQRLWPIRYRWGPVLRLLAAGIAVVAVSYLLPQMPLLASIGIKAVLMTLYVLAVMRLGILAPSERAIVRLLLTQPRLGWKALRAERIIRS